MNKAVLIGRLTKDPELRYTQSGTPVAGFTVAVNRQKTQNNQDPGADFISVVVWRGLAENCKKYLAKGRLIAVLGRIQTRNFDAQDGTKRYVTEVVGEEVKFLERAQQHEQTQQQDHWKPEGFNEVDGDGDLPF